MTRHVWGESPSEQLKANVFTEGGEGISLGLSSNGRQVLIALGSMDYYGNPDTIRGIAADLLRLADKAEANRQEPAEGGKP